MGILVFGLLAAVLYGVVGWILTAIGCAVYNLVAGWVGGIEVQVDQIRAASCAAAVGAHRAAARATRYVTAGSRAGV